MISLGLRWRVLILTISVLAFAAVISVGRFPMLLHSRSIESQQFPIPHEDPSVRHEDHDAAALLQYFADGLTYIRTQRYLDATALHSILKEASSPESLRPLVDRLGGLVNDLTTGMEDVDVALADAQRLLKTNRRAEAAALLTQARQLLRRNEILRESSQKGLQQMAASLGIPSLPATAPERKIFTRLEGGLRGIDDRERRIDNLLRQMEKGNIVDLGLSSTSLRWSVPRRAYPGLPFVASGAVMTQSANVDQPRQLIFQLDDRALGNYLSRGRFQVQLIPPSDFPPGWHALTLIVRAKGRYAEISETRTLELTRSSIRVGVHATRAVWLPGTVTVSGEVSSRLGPLEAAKVEAQLGNVRHVTSSGPGGAFRLALNPPVTLGFVGPQLLEVRVVPMEPWNAPAEVESRVLVVNLISIGLASVAFVPLITAYAQIRNRKKNAKKTREDSGFEKIEKIVSIDAPSNERVSLEVGASSTGERVLRVYRDAVRQIEASTGVRLQPHLTLREFHRATLPVLKGQSFAQMTGLAELALYSCRPITEAILERMQHLREELKAEWEEPGDRHA